MCVVSWYKCVHVCSVMAQVCMCVVSWYKCVHVCSVMVQVCACVGVLVCTCCRDGTSVYMCVGGRNECG